MINLFSACSADPQIALAQSAICADGKKTLIYGLTGSQKSLLISSAYQNSGQMLIVAHDQSALEQLNADLTALLPQEKIMVLPPLDLITFAVAAKSIELSAERLDVLGRLLRGEKIIVLTTSQAAMQKVPPRQDFLSSRITLTNRETVNRENIIADLTLFGYERVDEVDAPGQFCVKGGIIDIFAINADLPVRLELFGDEIESLREFDPHTQRSVKEKQFADILPFTQQEIKGKAALVFSYLENNAAIIFDEPARIKEKINALIKENPEIKRAVAAWPDLIASCASYNTVFLSLLLQKVANVEQYETIGLTAKSIAPFHRQMDRLVEELKRWQEKKYSTIILMSSKDKAIALRDSLLEEKITAILPTGLFSPLEPGKTLLTEGSLAGGFEFPKANLAVVTEMDIWGRQKKKRHLRLDKKHRISYFRDINAGDYIVHVNHGIGKYVGVKTIETEGIHRDYLHIKYAGNDKLYVPIDQVNLLQKYIGSEGEAPRLSRMGGSDWLKVKSKAKAAAGNMAKELLELYAKRQIQPGFAFQEDTPWQKEFEDTFSFEETPDQLIAIEEVKRDMEKPAPMDRLLCGDVGFGKTEVAIRSAFKAILSGKQVAVLVPTTVLAQQHYQTFKARFEGFGAVVDVISRFRTAKEQKNTVKNLITGEIDVIIGTHRLLQKDLKFKDLGLLIVDEEQRFGVAQKEKLKKWQHNLDVLSLSATPIPRTLHMSLTGVRDMSIIETPPEDRYPVQSYVVEYKEEIVKEAINRELKRGGQVYFVYNKVATIDKVCQRLTEILPKASIKTAHGQMPEEILEAVMLDFYEGRSDVLVCTSIIENGLDVPNANTIIIYDADHFGLSQLYQMRGRVGRSKRLAYAYFTYRQDKVLSEVAEKRLQAVKEFAELGSGFKIAMRDLEIRGAGSLLGQEQHGHIINVGFEMYCRLLEEAVSEIKGENPPPPPLEPALEINVNAYLPGDYIKDATHKMEIYQKIASVREEEEVADLAEELNDRFGDVPPPVLNLLNVARIKNLARKIGISSIAERNGRLEIVFAGEPDISPGAINNLSKLFKERISFPPKLPLTIRLFAGRSSKPAPSLDSLDTIAKILSVLKNDELV